MEKLQLNENRVWNKIPELTLLFWIIKILCTTVGETGGDLLAQTMKLGYGTSTMIFFGFFLVMLAFQLISKKCIPPVYWAVIIATSTAGTTMSDYMDRTLGLGYTLGSIILISILIVVLVIWKISEKSISVSEINSRRGEIFYWTAILFSNTLGTALGDFLADDSGLGFAGSAMLITGVLLLVVLAYYFTRISHVVLFWIAFVLTRPFGATFGDLLTKPKDHGGLAFGTMGATIILLSLAVILIAYEMIQMKQHALRMQETLKQKIKNIKESGPKQKDYRWGV